MKPRAIAIAVCKLLEDGLYHDTQYLLSKLQDEFPKLYGDQLRKVLRMLEVRGVVNHYGKGKLHWQLVRKDYNRVNPFVTPTTPGATGATDMPTLADHAIGFALAKFKGACPRCANPIHYGDTLVTWKGHTNPRTGRDHWVHQSCEAAAHDKAADHDKTIDNDKAVDNDKAATNGHANNEEIQKLIGRVTILENTKSKLQQRIDELEKERPPREIILTKPDKKKVKLDTHVHPIFEQVMFHIQAKDNVMLVGPRGCGKTFLTEQVGKALDRPFGMISLSGGVTEGKLFGRVVPDINTGKNVYHRALFVELFEEGGVFLLDEVDAADPNVLLAVNSGLANGVLALDRQKNPMASRHEDFVCLAAANTWGNGADRQYVGRNQQDSAFTERFVQLPMDYDRELERALCPGASELLDNCWKWRDNISKNKLERTVSTRFICRAYNWLQLGKDLKYVESMAFAGWREDEIRKAKGGY